MSNSDLVIVGALAAVAVWYATRKAAPSLAEAYAPGGAYVPDIPTLPRLPGGFDLPRGPVGTIDFSAYGRDY